MRTVRSNRPAVIASSQGRRRLFALVLSAGLLLGTGALLLVASPGTAASAIIVAEDDGGGGGDSPADPGTSNDSAPQQPSAPSTPESPAHSGEGGASDAATTDNTPDDNASPDDGADGADVADEPANDNNDGNGDETADDADTADATDDAGEASDEATDSANPELTVDASSSATPIIAGAPTFSINGSPGTPISMVTVSVNGAGLAPGSPFEVVVYSTPQSLASGMADAQGAFTATATLPAGLVPGAHTVVFRGTDANGQLLESGVGFTVAPDGTLGEVSGPVTPEALATLAAETTPATSGRSNSNKAPAFEPVRALDNPQAVVTTSIAGLTLVTAVAAAVVGSSGGSGSGSGSGSGGGSSEGGVDAKVEDRRKRRVARNELDQRDDFDDDLDTDHNRGWRTKFQPQGTRPGDLAVTHRFPGTAFTDELSYASILAVAPKSPLLARTLDDAGAWRAMFGSLSLLLPIAGLVLGITSAISTGGVAQPPALALMVALIVVGVLDAFAGLLALVAFTVGIAVSGGIVDLSSVRTLMGIALLVVGPGLIASSFRDTRRPAARTRAQWWERATDLVVVPLLGGWVTLNVVQALPGLGGYAFPIAANAGMLALIVMALLVINVLLEEAAARWFPERLATVLPSERPDPGPVQMVISGLFRTGLFLFISAAFVGNVWQLWAAAVLFTIPALVRAFEDRLPNSARLWQVLPLGVPQVGLLLIVSGIVAAAISAALGQTAEFAQTSFVVLAVPGFLLDALGAFGREPKEGDVRWYCRPSMVVLYRIGGVAILLVTVWLALNV